MKRSLLVCRRLALAFLFFLVCSVAQAQTTVTYDQQYEKAGLPLPSIQSDKVDYAPGEVAIITGTGWLLDTYVDVHFTEDPVHEHHHSYHDTKVNEDGTWEIRFQIDERHLGVSFTVDAVGKQTGVVAYAYFTDGNVNFKTSGLPSGTLVTVSVTYDQVGAAGIITEDVTFQSQSTGSIAAQDGTTVSYSYPSIIVTGGVTYVLNTTNPATGFISGNGATNVNAVYTACTPASFTACPTNIITNTAAGVCTAVVNYTATATGSPNPTYTFSFSGATPTPANNTGTGSGSTFNKGTTTVTITASNGCGTSATCTFTVTVNDNQAPTITTCPPTKNISGCSTAIITPTSSLPFTSTAATITLAQFQAEGGVASDNCAITSITYQDAVTGTCTKVVTRTFTVSDGVNSAATCTQTINIVDDVAPTGTAPTAITGVNFCLPTQAEADGAFDATLAASGYTDNCGGSVTATMTSAVVSGSNCAWTVTYTFSVKDECNNTLSGQTYTRSGSDQTRPVITSVNVDQTCLWPPNHKMRNVVVTPIFTDNCSIDNDDWYIVSVSSNEPANSTGDGNTEPDYIIGSDGRSLQLRAERQGTGDGRIYTVTVGATDNCGNISDTKSVEVYVAHNIHAPYNGNAVKVGTIVNFGGTFWDVAGKKHSAKWLVDGSAVATGTVVEPSGRKNGTVTGSYKFTTPGIYKLQMNITDQNGVTTYANTNGELQAMVVVYDPNGGFTVGNGSFSSPKGSIPGNPNATPKIGFGFQSNYFKNATNPKGETEFNFDAGDFQFNALNFEYLVVKDAFAQYKGTGKISNENGVIQSGISFIMTVIDGQVTGGGGVDKIRMKIFNKNSGEVYYDNMPGASDEMVPVTQIDPGGDIVVTSTPTNGKTEIVTTVVHEAAVDPKAFNVKAYPNPSEQFFNLNVQSGSQDAVDLKVFDMHGRVVYTNRGSANQSYRFGDKFVAGIYLVEVRQGDKRSVIQIVKQ